MKFNGFTLIGIRLLNGNPIKVVKNLEQGIIYPFFSNYKFIFKGKEPFSEVTKIEKTKSSFDLYSEKGLNVNVSAVVGKNGSGKSSLLEAFYYICYVIAVKEGHLEELKGNSFDDLLEYQQLNCEVYYECNDCFYKLKLDDQKLTYEELIGGEFVPTEKLDSKKFFFTLTIDYSLYGLNEKHHAWAGSLFHKNDGYKIPLVINPYRTNGNIDVNNESHLAQSRTLLNLANQSGSNPELINGKRVKGIEFKIDPSELDVFKFNKPYTADFWQVLDDFTKETDISFLELFNELSERLSGFSLTKQSEENIAKLITIERKKDVFERYLFESSNRKLSSDEINLFLIKYSIRKFFKIAVTYSNTLGIDSVREINSQKILTKFIQDFKKNKDFVLNDQTHITLKLRQALNTIKWSIADNFSWNILLEKIRNNNDDFIIASTYVDWNKFKESILQSSMSLSAEDKIQAVPFAFLKPSIKVYIDHDMNIVDPKDEIPFNYEYLSSGEQHLSNVIQTVTYHLRNIDSVHYDTENNERAKYNFVNIIMDEIELYFHPEFQRSFIKNLLINLFSLNLKFIKSINVLFSTHSPFILSDIPSNNILRIDKGKIIEAKQEETFGANINNILANDFFLYNGFMGEFVSSKINNLLDFLTSKEDESPIPLEDKPKSVIEYLKNDKTNTVNWDEENSLDFIELIGEKLLRNSLLELHRSKFNKQLSYEELLKFYKLQNNAAN